MSAATELVSVVIPAYNAAETLNETLSSVRAQTHRALDVIIVDDGSRDDTPAIAARHVRDDSRLRLITQKNAGAAVARNHAIAVARGELIAPIDADDLWRPDKIARQLEVLRRSGPKVGLVYTWFASIDRKSRVTSLSHRPEADGDVMRQMCQSNLVGNGSSPLMPKRVLTEVGGYDPQQPHFCEDLSLYLRIAERYRFAVVRDHLTGYRQTTGSMSNRTVEMLRAHDRVLAEFRPRYPQYAAEFDAAHADMVRWLFRKAVKAGKLREARLLYTAALKISTRFAAGLVFDEVEDWDKGLRGRIGSTLTRGVSTAFGGGRRSSIYFLESAVAVAVKAISCSIL